MGGIYYIPLKIIYYIIFTLNIYLCFIKLSSKLDYKIKKNIQHGHRDSSLLANRTTKLLINSATLIHTHNHSNSIILHNNNAVHISLDQSLGIYRMGLSRSKSSQS